MAGKRTCIFCGSTKLTKEHVFPDWMSKHFDKRLTATTTVTKAGHEDKVYQSALFQHAVKVVCASCNNGWMSQLESDTKAFLEPMLFDETHTTNLDQATQKLLATWAQKTVLVLNHGAHADYKIPREFYEKLYQQNTAIDEISVRIGWRLPKQGKYGPHLVYFTIGQVLPSDEDTSIYERAGGHFEVWRAIIGLKNMVFHVSGASSNVRVEVGNVDKRVTPQIQPYEADLGWPTEWPVDALTSTGFTEFQEV